MKIKLLLFLLMLFTPAIIYSQCVPNTGFTSAGIYPDTLPNGTAGVTYSEDVTFVMLTDTMGLTIYNYQITNITGLPIGIAWQCNNFQNGCVYDPASSIYGCVHLSGTPAVPGTFTFTVTVLADVQFVGQQTISFDRPLTILPASVSNPGFAMQNSTGCAPLTVSFTNNNPGQTSYQWDFGNGLQSTQENPPSQTYTTPGNYVVQQTVVPNSIPDYYLTNITVMGIPNNYGGPIDDPDPYFLLYDPSGSLIYDSRPALNGVFPPCSWGTPNIQLANGNYTIHVWDEDGGLFGADDDLGAASFAGHSSSGTTTGSVSGASGTLVVNYTIFQTPIVPLTATDTIHVYAMPSTPVISPGPAIIICEGDAITLSVANSGDYLQWYESGQALIGDTSNQFTPIASGNYSVTATTSQGCSALSNVTSVTINPLPVKPTFFINGNTFTTGVTGVNLQWYLNGNAIAGANNTSYTAAVGGVYRLCATDANGCSNCSDSLVYSGVGMAETSTEGFALFPNPANGPFSLLAPAALEGKYATIYIYDMAGRLVYKLSQPLHSHNLIDLKLDPGSYFVTITGDGIEGKTKLIIN